MHEINTFNNITDIGITVEETANPPAQNAIELTEIVNVIAIGITGTPSKGTEMVNEVKKKRKKGLEKMIEDQTEKEVINVNDLKDLAEVIEQKTSQKVDLSRQVQAPVINIRKAKKKRKKKAIKSILRKK